VVQWLGAVQAQEFEAAKWAIGLRMLDDAAMEDVERAIDEGRILRTHVMRPPWHFVAATDLQWLLELTGPRVQQAMAYHRRYVGLDDRTVTRALRIVERVLGDAGCLTRRELATELERARLPMAGQRLAHLAMHAELERVICSGPRRARPRMRGAARAESTYALFAKRVPNARKLTRDEALATLAGRFFASHGPATTRDFSWWSGLTIADARRSIEMIRARGKNIEGHTYWTAGRAPSGTRRDRLVHLLPIYDEYLVAYRDRDVVPHGVSAGTFQSTLIVAGQVAGTWRVARQSSDQSVDVRPTRRLTGRERRALGLAVERYKRFVSES